MSQFIEMFGGESNKVTLDEIVVVKDDCRRPINEGVRSEMKDGELYPYYGATGVVDYINDYLIDEELLCIAEDCGNYNAGEESAYIIRGKAWVNNHAHLVKTKESCDVKYLYYFLKIADLKPYVSGTTRLKLTQKKLKEISVTLPSIDKQKTFVKIAEQADKSEFVGCKSQFIEMFGNQNTNDKGWTESLVKDEFKLSMGKTPARNNPECWDNGTHKWVSISDMSSYTRYTGDTSEYITDYAIADSGIKAVPKGTIIMSFKLSIGRTAITSEDLYTNEAIMAFAGFDEKKFNIDFLHFLIANKNWLLGAKQAVKGQTLNKESIGNAKIIIPPIEAQEEFASIYNQADKSEYYN